MRTLLFWLTLPPSTLVFSLVSVVGGWLGASAGLHDWVHRNWARCVLGSAGVRVRVRGTEHLRPEGGQILASNHQSMFDIWALFRGVPASVRFVAKAELERIPVFARACREAGHVFIPRRRPAEALTSMREAGRRMAEEGLTLGLFPEGTRSPDGQLRRFKSGPFLLAIHAGAPVFPVAISGSAGIMPKGRFRIRPGVVEIRIGEPYATGDLSANDRGELARAVHAEVASMLGDVRSVAGGTSPGPRDGGTAAGSRGPAQPHAEDG